MKTALSASIIAITILGLGGLGFVVDSALAQNSRVETTKTPRVETPRVKTPRVKVRGSDLAIPRFVTIKAGRANMRTGPSENHPISWEYRKPGLPLKVVGEFEHWRKVEDHDGDTGWMHVSVLSRERMVLITDSTVLIHGKASPQSGVVAVAEGGVVMELRNCNPGWCHIGNDDAAGWVRRDSVWGLLEGEQFE